MNCNVPNNSSTMYNSESVAQQTAAASSTVQQIPLLIPTLTAGLDIISDLVVFFK